MLDRLAGKLCRQVISAGRKSCISRLLRKPEAVAVEAPEAPAGEVPAPAVEETEAEVAEAPTAPEAAPAATVGDPSPVEESSEGEG